MKVEGHEHYTLRVDVMNPNADYEWMDGDHITAKETIAIAPSAGKSALRAVRVQIVSGGTQLFNGWRDVVDEHGQAVDGRCANNLIGCPINIDMAAMGLYDPKTGG